MKKSYLVIGGSGLVGSEIVRLLKAQGQTVRMTTSKKNPLPSVDGIEQVHADFITGEGLKEAFKGIHRVFLMSPGGYADQYAVLSKLIQEAKDSKLEKVVLMTAMGANADASTPFRRAEIELEKSGLMYNIIRPNWFMQNFHTFWIHGIKEQKKILLPAGDAKVSFIDTRDISEVAVKLLIDDTLKNRDFDLTGALALDHQEVASLISEASSKRIAYQEISPDVFKTGLLGAGLPEDYVDFLNLILGFLKAGYNKATTPNVKVITGHDPRSVKSYVNDFKDAF